MARLVQSEVELYDLPQWMVGDHSTKAGAEPHRRKAILLSLTLAPTWRPLSVRTAAAPERAPSALRDDLRDWLFSAASKKDLIERAVARLNLRIVPSQGTETRPYYLHSRYALAYDTADRRLLDIVDAVLALLPPSKSPDQLTHLRRVG